MDGVPIKTVDEVFHDLLESGVSEEQLYESVTRQHVEIVLTAHPTQVGRRRRLRLGWVGWVLGPREARRTASGRGESGCLPAASRRSCRACSPAANCRAAGACPCAGQPPHAAAQAQPHRGAADAERPAGFDAGGAGPHDRGADQVREGRKGRGGCLASQLSGCPATCAAVLPRPGGPLPAPLCAAGRSPLCGRPRSCGAASPRRWTVSAGPPPPRRLRPSVPGALPACQQARDRPTCLAHLARLLACLPRPQRRAAGCTLWSRACGPPCPSCCAASQVRLMSLLHQC